MTSVVIGSTAHISSETPLNQALSAWNLYLNDQGKSIHTIKAFIADLNLLASYLPPDRQIGSVTTPEINNFLEWMQKGRGIPCSPKTLSRRITSIKSFFRWLQNNGAILTDPAEKVLQKSVLSPIPENLTEEEIQAILDAANRHRTSDKPDARPYALVALLLDTGIKKGECLAIAPNHIDLNAPSNPILFVRYANPKHRYKERKITLTDDWLDAYEEYRNQYNLQERLFPWSPRRLEYILEDLGKEAHLEKHLSFLMCRWTCALADYKGGMEHNKIRQKLGISEIQWREIKMKLGRLSKKSDGE